jgi:hypothetical protein
MCLLARTDEMSQAVISNSFAKAASRSVLRPTQQTNAIADDFDAALASTRPHAPTPTKAARTLFLIICVIASRAHGDHVIIASRTHADHVIEGWPVRLSYSLDEEVAQSARSSKVIVMHALHSA